MNIAIRDAGLPSLIDRASTALLGARTSAEILEARDFANVAYSAAKLAARLSKAKHAHDKLIAAAHRAQADALEIEAGAKRRLADEYDAAQERGEVASQSDGRRPSGTVGHTPTVTDIGLTHKDIHEARKVRDAEVREPGITRRALDAMLAQGREPTKANLRREIWPDEDEEIEEETPSRKRDAFLVFSNEAMLLAKYDGPVDSEIIEAARMTEQAWSRLVATMEKGK